MTDLLLHFSKSELDDLLVLERGEGPYVFDTHGRRYIDALSGLFCAQIGSSHGEEMAAAAGRQLTTLAFNTNWGTAHPAALELAERLAAEAPGDLNAVFFASGGSESARCRSPASSASRRAEHTSSADGHQFFGHVAIDGGSRVMTVSPARPRRLGGLQRRPHPRR